MQIFCLLYVDDILIIGTSSSMVDSVIQSLQNKFALKDLGELHYFLGVEATWSHNGLFLS